MNPTADPTPAPPVRIPSALALGAIFVAMASLSWGKWPDVLTDFGRELYVPWQLSQGKVLGRDLAWWMGPLSPYVNALLFAAFGPGLRTLVLFNLALLAGLTPLLHALVREMAGRLAALAAGAVFLAVFAFGQYLGTGNYNFVTPYSHGITHGVLLSACALALLWRHAQRGRLRDLAGAALAVGLVALTKPELFLACAAAYAVALLLWVRRDRAAALRPAALAAATVPVLAPAAISFAWLAAVSGTGNALRMTAGAFLTLSSPMARTPFYAWCIGLDDPAGNAWRALRVLGAAAVVLGPAAAADVLARRVSNRWLPPVAAAAVTAVGLVALVPFPAWLDVARPLPLLAGAAAIAYLVAAWRAGRACDGAAVLRATFATFAAALLLKIVLNARVQHYGFALAMPATLLVVGWLVGAIPARLRRLGGTGEVFRASALVAIALCATTFVRISAAVLQQKTWAVGAGPDVLLADRRGVFVSAILEALERESRPGDTVAVLPEGVMINYLARRPSPSPYQTFLPDELFSWGEEAMLAPLAATPPTFVVLVSRDSSEFGPATFGVDYAQRTLAWIEANYVPVGSVGTSPLQRAGYGMMLLRRRDASAAAAPAATPAP